MSRELQSQTASAVSPGKVGFLRGGCRACRFGNLFLTVMRYGQTVKRFGIFGFEPGV